MLADSITLPNAAAANKTFTKRLTPGPETVRLETTSPLNTPTTMRIRNQSTKQKDYTLNRQNVAFQSLTDVSGVIHPTRIGVTIESTNDATAAAKVDDLFAYMLAFFGNSANKTAVLRGEG